MLNISIRKKILVIPIVGVIGFFSYVFISSQLLKSAASTISVAKNQQLPLVMLARENIFNISKVQETLSYAASSGETDVLTMANKIQNLINANFDSAEKISPALSEEIKDLKAQFNSYYSVAFTISRKMTDGSINFDTLPSKTNEMTDKLKRVESSMDQFYKNRVAQFDNAFIDAQAKSKKVFTSGVLIGLVMSILLLGVGFLISRVIKNNLDAVTARLKDIAQNDADITLRLTATSKDELGDLANWFNAFADKLQHVIEQIVELAPPLANVSTDVKALTSNMSLTLQNQQSSITESRNSIERIDQSVADIAQHATLAADAAKAADTDAIEGKKIVDKAVIGIEKLSLNINNASEVITKLKDDTQSVNVVLDVIKSIAEQTNLLALNAAIEAARAGEQGRGFAVVADEVRSLASRTQESTEEINTILEQLQAASEAAVDTMQQSTNAVSESVSEVKLAGNSLESIASAANTIYNMNEQIAKSTDEQKDISQALVEEAEHINERTNESSESAAQLDSLSEQLNQLASNLELATRQFKL